MKLNLVFAALLAASVLAPAVPAEAGVVIIIGREASFVTSDGGSARLAVGGKKSNSSSTASTTSALSVNAVATPVETPAVEEKGDTETPESEELSAYELEQIRQGLISEEEASSGCGGASAAAGPAGLLPLAITGLALLRRRRR